jgi:hypothetical protein
VLHSQGGAPGQLSVSDNYFDAPGCARIQFIEPNQAPVGLRTDGCSDGTGSVNAILAQYEFSLTNFLRESQGEPRLSGDAQDLRLVLYGLYASVQSDSYDTTTGAGATAAAPLGYEVNKLKFGGDLTWAALPWLSSALRFDRVQPELAHSRAVLRGPVAAPHFHLPIRHSRTNLLPVLALFLRPAGVQPDWDGSQSELLLRAASFRARSVRGLRLLPPWSRDRQPRHGRLRHGEQLRAPSRPRPECVQGRSLHVVVSFPIPRSRRPRPSSQSSPTLARGEIGSV